MRTSAPSIYAPPPRLAELPIKLPPPMAAVELARRPPPSLVPPPTPEVLDIKMVLATVRPTLARKPPPWLWAELEMNCELLILAGPTARRPPPAPPVVRFSAMSAFWMVVV